MSVLVLSSLQKSGLFVSSDMFGANAVFGLTDDGVPTSEYADAAAALGVQNIRFGGGQADLDPLKPNGAGELPVQGENAINIVEMQDGALRSELVDFLDWCEQTTANGTPTKATLIIPTKHLAAADYTAFAQEIEDFTTLVMQRYGDVIAAFQMGNEYWEMGETSYGVKASLGAEALARGMVAAGIAEADQPDILVQMGTAGNLGSEFPAVPGVNDFMARNQAANNQIIDQLSEEARAAIDGVTEHYYYNKLDYAFGDLDSSVKNINKDFDIWAGRLGGDLDLHITEWNVKTTAETQHGMVAGSSMVKQFENMIAIGADGAHVWALDYHSRTALTLDTDDGVRLDELGRLTNSSQGAVFDLMSEALVGKELVTAGFTNGLPDISVTAYADQQEMVFYITSRSLEMAEFTLDLAAKLPVAGPVEAVLVSMDRDSANGLQWKAGTKADSVFVDGQPYYYNEHDVDVVLTDLVFTDASQIDLALKPFEVIELTVTLDTAPVPEPPRIPPARVVSDKHYFLGDEADNMIQLTDNIVFIDSGAGIDTLFVDALRSEASVGFDGFGRPVLSAAGFAPEVVLTHVERIGFNDGVLALDLDGNSGQAYRLYQASFDRTPDLEGLEFWVQQLDSGALSLEEVAEQFLTSAEFTGTYGQNDALGDSEFIGLLYENVLERSPDAAGYDFWLGQAEQDVGRDQILVSFSESGENKQLVAPSIDDGIWFG
ncbi:DUF4214 domain-containing protein [Sulfitobacter sp. M57]|uniref:DUF4214 domain-containing protein n=1 Tax=unclassified Sulfitobacter TaxID=196795 RepID=UPI0023E16420|nr:MULTISPECIES: DUF4214 domain-containing protein [unclassified Sulfitobacter]MDF3414742.1 DUF4214 domain-containing protein [Sulfitobacter sp. KE5]MDF3422223.1 DUF4214 domain-containing protein [Sulfitobacter sp. KE43]MDF3433288.1 DUF4214 domain-containing protein [Sulfitobacter sp. KE42]MDF3458928.1 DUF4214 domain-containing protein [Sulfitobacter sp. S74]MDF3462827.1 DUF4214 domain-containing protein [Sulfitobacter sp. Ks18]